LLGRTLLAVAGRQLPTPSYFLLERGARVEHVASPPRATSRGADRSAWSAGRGSS
jgi:hypothetical protein